jgi:hypothetical protein
MMPAESGGAAPVEGVSNIAPNAPPPEETAEQAEPPAEHLPAKSSDDPSVEPVATPSAANQNAIYERPFVISGQRAAIGGYVEANLNYVGEEGINEGASFELRRFNIFLFSPLGQRMRFLSELEFEHGTEEIALETALVDLEIVPELVLRAGILLTPLGAFNQAHDGPLWEFVDRPLVSTTIIPATFSEVGGGAHGTILVGPLDLDYQLYATQGLADGVLDNELGRTSIPHGRSEELLAEDNNGQPAVTGRVALRYRALAELGVSAWYGAYNSHEVDGEKISPSRTLGIGAVDFAFTPGPLEVRGEVAFAWIDVPRALESAFGSRQWGLYVDAIAPIYRFSVLGLDKSSLNVGARFEHVDYHAGELANGDPAGNAVTRVAGSVSFRPSAETVFRINYVYQWATDLVNNAPARRVAMQFGIATYF